MTTEAPKAPTPFRPGASVAAGRCTTSSGPNPTPSPWTSRPSSRPIATATGETRWSSTARTPCRYRPTSSCPTPASEAGHPGPAVLACHGHGPGKSQAVGLEHTDMPNADYAHQLARRGYVVLAPDLRCFGERRDWNPDDHYACDTNLVHAVMAGWNPLAQNVWDLRRALDVLEAHALVDPDRIGMCGVSYGGTVTLFTAASTSGSRRPSSAATSRPGPRATGCRGTCAAPRSCSACWAGSSTRTWAPSSRPVPCSWSPEPRTCCSRWRWPPSRSAAPASSTTASPPASRDRLVHDVFEGEHQWHGTEALPFFDRWLAPRVQPLTPAS